MRAIGHELHPIVIIGAAGLTDAVVAELDRALRDHELIKVRINADREERGDITAAFLQRTGATLVQATGAVALIYRAAEPGASRHLSNLVRHE